MPQTAPLPSAVLITTDSQWLLAVCCAMFKTVLKQSLQPSLPAAANHRQPWLSELHGALTTL